MLNFFPEDLLLDVLARLPVKSLKRFKCVSKEWCALIESREFVQMHLNRSSLKFLVGMAHAAQDSPHLPESYFLCAAEEFGSPENFFATREELSNPLQDFPGRKANKGRIRVVGSCNGLVCIRYSKYGVLVWNPWTRRHWILPHTRVETELCLGCRRTLPYSAFGYGFGYDEVNDDYKVVRIVQLENISSQHLGCEVKVFSMKSNSWRRIENFPYTAFRKDFSICQGILANGALHWMLSNYESNPPNAIVAVNLTTEEHQLLPAPDFGPYEFVFNFSVLNGNLCLISDHMWLMKEYGVKDSWREFILECPEDLIFQPWKPITYSASEKNFIFQSGLDELMWYGIEKISARRVRMSASPHLTLCDMFCTVATLVEPNCGGNKKFRSSRQNLKRKDVSLTRCSTLENRQPKKRERRTSC